MKILPVLTELSKGTMDSYRKKAIGDALDKHAKGGATNEIAACKRAKNVARSVRLTVKRRKMFEAVASGLSVEAAKARLAQLQADLKDMSVTPHSQEAADAIDEVRDEIKDLKAHIATVAVKESANSAPAAYTARLTQCHELLDQIKQGLDQHAQEQQGNADSWGFAGDLAHVAEQLQEIWEFMSSAEK
jgi:hypothetical protein